MYSVTGYSASGHAHHLGDGVAFDSPEACEEGLADLSESEVRDLFDTIASTEIGFVDNPRFRRGGKINNPTPEVEQIEVGNEVAIDFSQNGRGLPAHLQRMCSRPVLSQAEEQALFSRMNFLKYRANALRSRLPRRTRDTSKLCEILDLLARAARLRDHIILSNVRLVVSIAKHFTNGETSFDTALSEGISSLMHTVEKFDFQRGFRFSTYATRAIRRDLYRLVMKRHTQLQRFATGCEEQIHDKLARSGDESPSQQAWINASNTLQKMLEQLEPRESVIIRARFGFANPDGSKETFTAIGRQLGISKERVRQLFERALGKLRDLAPEFSLDPLVD